jgi:hypothetical protein
MMRTCVAALLGFVMSAGTAAAQCTVPNALTNNTNADATQVMANFNAILTCINNLPSPTGNPGFMNRLRNGSFVSWPNGYSGTVTTSPSLRLAISANGWAIIPTGASVTWAQVNGGYNGTTQSLRVTGASGVTRATIGQRIESFDAAQLAGRTVTFQMAVFNNTGASITPKLSTRYLGTADNWTTTPVVDVNAVDLQPCANAVWAVVAYTFTPNAGAANGYEVTIDFGNNFSSTSKSVQITAAEMRITPGASPGLNSSPPIPELPFVEAELRRNARYYQTSYANGTAPGSSTHAGMVGPAYFINGVFSSSLSVVFPVEMRSTPTLSQWDGAGTQNAYSVIPLAGGTSWTDGGSVMTPWNVSARGLFMQPYAANYSYYLHYAAYADFW